MARLVTYLASDGSARAALAVEDRLVDLAPPAGGGGKGERVDSPRPRQRGSTAQILAYLGEGAAPLPAAPPGSGVPIDGVRLLSPIPDPGKIICLGRNYKAHADEAELDVPEFPMLFAKYGNAVAGPHDPIRIPRVTHRIDYEGELAVVIGRRGRYIPREAALDHVGGFMVANDVSARDYQFRTSQLLSGKTFDGFAPMGPWLVTPDEVGELEGLRLRTWVNGEQRQSAILGEMIFDVPHLVSYISDIVTLEPGDVILTGTPGGVGGTMKPRRWLRPGDDVRIEIERVGTIRNRVEAEEEAEERA